MRRVMTTSLENQKQITHHVFYSFGEFNHSNKGNGAVTLVHVVPITLSHIEAPFVMRARVIDHLRSVDGIEHPHLDLLTH